MITYKTTQQTKDFASSERIPFSHILIDEDGIGGGVIDNLQGVKGFTANSSPIQTASQIRERMSKLSHSLVPKPVYSNIKAQCGWKLAEMINEHKIAFKTPDYREVIIEELTSILRDKSVDGEGKKQLRPKIEVKEEIGRSPDIGDTILMRMLFEIQKDSSGKDDVVVARAFEEQEMIFTRNKSNRAINSSR